MGYENVVTVGRICLFVVLITAGFGCEKDSDAAGQTGSDSDTEAMGDTMIDSEGGTETGNDDSGGDSESGTSDTGGNGLEDWDMYLTVDNMFDVYFGTPTQTTGEVVGRGDNWQKEYHFAAIGRLSTDFMYVATASDHSVAQGFLGTFTNLTLGKTTNTGDAVWEVFPAGAHEATNPHWPNPWPASVMPTQAEVDVAIAYAQANGLWVTPVSPPGYDNDQNTSIAPATSEWRTHCNPECTYDHIPTTARWIWHDSGRGPTTTWTVPLAGFNHDEFLVFRVAGAVSNVY